MQQCCQIQGNCTLWIIAPMIIVILLPENCLVIKTLMNREKIVKKNYRLVCAWKQ